MLLECLPLFPHQSRLQKWLAQAVGIKPNPASADTIRQLMYFCSSRHPAPKQLLPKLVSLLKLCHASDQKMTNWYFDLQETILNHYLTEGNCFFFGGAKEILSGEQDFGMEKIMKLRDLYLQ
jgi:hypothetical protein